MDTLATKQSALLVLIEDSILLSYGQKLTLLEEFASLNEQQIDALGQMLAAEEQMKTDFAPEILKGMDGVLASIVTPDSVDANTVYVGVGKPS